MKIVKIFYPKGEFETISYDKYVKMMDRAKIDTTKEYTITIEPLEINDLITITQESFDGTDGAPEGSSKET